MRNVLLRRWLCRLLLNRARIRLGRFVCFRNSELLSGRLGKVTLGSGNKAGLFYALSSDYSPDVAANAMNRLAKLSARWLGTRGFSIGIADVTPDERLITEKERQARVQCALGRTHLSLC